MVIRQKNFVFLKEVINMVVVISGPKYLQDVEDAMVALEQMIAYKKVDRDIDILEEQENLYNIKFDLLILDISCVEDYKKVPRFIRHLKKSNDNLRVIIIAPYSFSGYAIMNDLITMGIYNIIGQKEDSSSSIMSDLINLYEAPSTYAKAIKWDKGVQNRRKQEQDFVQTGEGRFGKKKKDIITIEKNKIVGTVVIAVAGAMSRVGTTHTAISIAIHLVNNRHGVAIVELQHSNTFNAIRRSYKKAEQKNHLFSLRGIDFYPYNPSLAVSDILLGDYAYVILDMGHYLSSDVNEFKRAQERIIVSGGKDWELEELDNLLKSEDKSFANKYLFSFCDISMFEFIKANMETLKCYQAAYNPQPFEYNDSSSEIFDNMLQDVLPQTHEEQRGLVSTLIKNKDKKGYHHPVLVKKAERKKSEKEDFLKFIIVVLLIVIALIVIAFFVLSNPIITQIKDLFN